MLVFADDGEAVPVDSADDIIETLEKKFGSLDGIEFRAGGDDK